MTEIVRWEFDNTAQIHKIGVMKPSILRIFSASTTVLASLFAHTCFSQVATPAIPIADIGTAVKVSACSIVFGGGLQTPEIALRPMLFELGWTSHGSTGAMEADTEGWRSFSLHTAKNADSPKVNGKVRFAETGDGQIQADWFATPERDVDLEELCVAGNFPLSGFAGGVAVTDGRTVELPVECQKMHIFRNAVTNLAILDKTQNERLKISFPAPTRILLQDNRSWGGMDFTLRIFFAEGPVKGGKEYSVRAKVSTPSAGPLVLSDGKPVTIEAGSDWIPLAGEPWIEPGSALDFSSVIPHHAPAGKFGRVVAVGDHFEFEGLPGVPQRFYGVNICGDANTPSTPEAAERFAANLARMGYNSLRIHHHERALLGGQYRSGMDDTMPDPAAMDKFDSLVAACIKHGIYVTTDLFVSRSWFTTWRSLGIDRDGCLPGTEIFKMLCAFWEPAFDNLCAWSRNFLGHVNPYTGRSLADEPALCALALVNEGNLGNWGGARLGDIPGVQQAWDDWLSKHPDVAAKAGIDTAKGPAPVPKSLYADDGSSQENRLSAAFAIFLADSEARLADRLTAFLRNELCCYAPLSSLSCWYNPVQYQAVRTRFDYVDDHFYVDHPSFLGQSWKLPSRCPNTNPMSGTRGGARPVVFRRLMDKPFCITEWNYSGPGRYRGVGGIATGALGALQNWSGLWRFAWSHGRMGLESPEKKTLSYFDMSGDPLGLAAERAAMCLFLRGDIEPLHIEYPICLRGAALRDPAFGAPKCQADSWVWAAWFARLGTRVLDDSTNSATGSRHPYEAFFRDHAAVRNDLDALGAKKSGEGAISIDPDSGTFLIDTARTVGGFAENGAHTAGPLSFSLAEAPATVWVSSLDGQPIERSQHMLLTHLTDVQNSGIKYADEGLTILLDWGSLPHLMRRGRAEITLSFAPATTEDGGDDENARQWHVWRLSPAGRRIAEIPLDSSPEKLRFTVDTAIDPSCASFLYEIERRQP